VIFVVRVLIIQNTIVPYEIHLFERLARESNIDLFVIFCHERYRLRKWDIKLSDSFRYKILKGITIDIGEMQSSINFQVMESINQFGPDVVILSGGYNNITHILSFLYCKLKKVPIIYRTDKICSESVLNSLPKMMFSIIEKLLAKSSDAIICHSKKCVDCYRTYGIPHKKLFIAPYTTECDSVYVKKCAKYRKNKEKIKTELGISEDKLILYVGQFIKRKGINYLIEAYRLLRARGRNVGLVLLGDGPLRDQYNNYIKRNKIKGVYLPGFVDWETKLRYYAISDVFVLPSLFDLWGVVVNEAMLCGLPVVLTSNVGASEMVIDGVNGHVVPPQNTSGLYHTLDEILFSESDVAVSMGNNAFSVVTKKYNIEKRVAGYLEAIKYALM